MKQTLRQAAIALVATLLILELALQLASVFAGSWLGRSSALSGSGEEIVILCVGDSHTYGAPLPQEESYPSQLWDLLEERYPSRSFRVINLGFPGVNSAFLASRLESQIQEIRPDLIMASGGLNNVWNDLDWNDLDWKGLPADAHPPSESRWTALRQALLNVKLFRLAAVATSKTRLDSSQAARGRTTSSDHAEVKARLDQRLNQRTSIGVSSLEVDAELIQRGLVRDMTRMAEMAHAHDTPIIWYNYPGLTPKVKTIQALIDATGAELGIPVVHTEEDVERALADGYEEGDLAVYAAGPHPTGILYGYIVRSMLPQVVLALKEWRGIDLDAP